MDTTASPGLRWTDCIPDTPPELAPAPAPIVVLSTGLFDIADLPSLCAWIRVCPRAYTVCHLTAKARERAAILALQRKVLIALLARRAKADFQALFAILSAAGGLEGWTPLTEAEKSDSDLD